MENLIVEYHFSPGLSDEIKRINLKISNIFNFETTIFWYKKPDTNVKFTEEYGRSMRRENLLKGNLPLKLKNILEELISYPEFELKTFYPALSEEQKKQYTPSDVRQESYDFYLRGKKYWINVSPYIFNAEFLKTAQELLFKKFHKEITEWLSESYEKLIQQED
ncbi:hypothetical protein QE422_000427 [Chryseobacterium sp. SORGH_AS 447]|uniref:hypothetical protein n=1 Tax=Chryseobacterium sp. SORGH_AS_0447 TaxID=3041769 RepID=UPI00277DE1C1|nr:hypothetical protein [Chryseobacterium sp. SORGH_AS_0447]MDQ1160059.1 hypothetical protein [Chryseobacterium sp. SORGH_AS_0447]